MAEPSSSTRVRLAEPDDVATIFQLIKHLADYEKLAHEVVGYESLLQEHLFGDRPYIESFIVESGGTPAGFALFFQNYSISVGTPGYYLEDLFVLPTYRGQGLGKALLSALAQRAVDQQYHHLQWSVLDWNAPAIAFYQKIGADISETERIARLTGDALTGDALTNGKRQFEPTSHSFAIEQLTGDRLSDLAPLLEHLSDPQQSVVRTAIATHPPSVEAIAVYDNEHPIGLATFTHSYSTFLTRPGIVVESMITSPGTNPLEMRSVLLDALAQMARDRQCGRLEWLVDREDDGAIAQCESLGGTVKPDWRICRMEVEAIHALSW
ncbi:MAG: GNAT family N-acetyltransferase [Leptolyngbyaceae bacterium]|nr:GNAT family N-acetyltransferase [Leptolyngbyaceae bacterium]